MARYNRDSEQSVFSLMDGVPVKISEQFKPPRKVGLPHGYQQRMSVETPNEEYDYKLEHSVLQNIGEWRKLRKDGVDRRKERLKAQDAFEKQTICRAESPVLDPSLSSPNTVSPSSIPTSSTSYVHPVGNSFTSNSSILTPMQISQPLRQVRTSQISQFNFSDFEADTSSPFDNMELKTINEMEVLAHVLQPLSNSPDSKTNASRYLGTVSSSCVKAEEREKNVGECDQATNLISYEMYDSLPRDQAAYHFTSNNTTRLSHDYYLNETLPLGDINNKSENREILIENFDRMSMGNSVDVGYSPSRFVQSNSIPIKSFTQSPQSCQSKDYSNQILNSYKYSPVSGVGDTDNVSFPSSNQSSDKTHSTSVPDIVYELQKELRNRSHALPTPRPNSFGSTGLENWNPWPTLESPQSVRSFTKQRSPSPTGAANLPPLSTLNNPYNELSLAEQRMTEQLSEMGFPQARAARGFQALGADERKVLDFLLHVQKLESDGYPGDTAERAFVANDYEQTKTVEHLEAMKQLLDLGFNEEQIFDSLVRFNNDRDKALDHLIS